MTKTKIFARDLAKEKQTDSFMGKGFEEAMAKAEANGNDLIVGEFCPNEEWDEY